MNKKKIFLFLLFLVGVFLQPVTVWAGEVNANEQSVLNYVSGAVFEYQGESYVAKEEYINQLRAKFMQDDIDLTQKEANNAIMQINANVKTGVTDGYLKKVSENESEETPTGKAEVTITDVSGKQEKNEPGSENQNKEEKSTDSIKKLDIDNFVQKVLSQDTEAVKVSVEQDKKTGSSIVAVEQYLPGEMTVVSSKGEILFQGSLPVKNTGYETPKNAILLFTVFYCGFLMIITSKRMRGSKNET